MPSSNDMKNKIIAIRRDVRYSLNAEQKDREILASVIQCLGGDIPMIDEAQLTDEHKADVYLSMGRLPATLQVLRKRAVAGALVINTPKAVEACERKNIVKLMRTHHIPMPPEKGEHGYWLKRGDALAQRDSDVVFCQDEDELRKRKDEWEKRGILTCVESANVDGDLVKFYCVGHNFFRWYRLRASEQGYAFDAKELHRHACRLADIIGIDVFGGDCIVSEDGHFSIIDFNDWPSFSPCRAEAAQAIAQLLKEV